jgi:hypothetical protein
MRDKSLAPYKVCLSIILALACSFTATSQGPWIDCQIRTPDGSCYTAGQQIWSSGVSTPCNAGVCITERHFANSTIPRFRCSIPTYTVHNMYEYCYPRPNVEYLATKTVRRYQCNDILGCYPYHTDSDVPWNPRCDDVTLSGECYQ